jgi:translation initiation factor 1
MGRPDASHKKVEVNRAAAPLQSNPFAVLAEVDALKNLAPGPEEKKAKEPRDVPAAPTRKSRGRLVLRRETKDRGGKVVVVVSGLAELPGANAVMIADLARQLKGRLGCGGSFDRQEIVLQGDRCAEVCAALEEFGFRVDGVRG